MAKEIAVSRRGIRVALICGAAVVIVGCAAATPTVDTVSTADMALNRAIDAKAMQHAPLELRLAEEKLDRAKSALEEEDYEQARRLAEEAQVDARLAEARARSRAARQQAQEIEQTIDTLQREVDQKTPGQ
jgi:hypothetical protein